MYRESYKFYVDNVELTANYYKEYIGFMLVRSVHKPGYLTSVLLQYQDYVLILEKSVNPNNNKEVVLELSLNSTQMNNLYNNYKTKTRIHNVQYDRDHVINEFSIRDCNDNIICFKGK